MKETQEVFVGRFGLGARNAEGNNIVEFAQGMEMSIVNTFKRREHNITYKSGGRKSQIDYVMQNLKIMDYKIFLGESVTNQHSARSGLRKQ